MMIPRHAPNLCRSRNAESKGETLVLGAAASSRLVIHKGGRKGVKPYFV